MNNRIQSLILDSLAEIVEDHQIHGLDSPGPDTRLYGAKSPLDSMALVNLIAAIEGRLAEEFDCDIVLADERAMDQRLTPFARVSTLTDYIAHRLSEESSHA